MKATTRLHELGQSLWLDDITREMLDSGALSGLINDFR
jgi:transaldolase